MIIERSHMFNNFRENNRQNNNSEYMSEIHSFNFKLVYSEQIKSYDLNVGIASDNTYILLTDKIRDDFGLEEFDIVICGQEQDEIACALPQNRTSMRMHLNYDYSKSFYIRPKVNNRIISSNSNDSNNASFEIGTCVVCLQDNIAISRHYRCLHRLCRSCNDRWARTDTMSNCGRCPECRSE